MKHETKAAVAEMRASLGKGRDRTGRLVRHGMTVFENMRTTDQHSYVKQLRAHHSDYSTMRIQVQDSSGAQFVNVDPEIHSADYLVEFHLGTGQALVASDRVNVHQFEGGFPQNHRSVESAPAIARPSYPRFRKLSQCILIQRITM